MTARILFFDDDAVVPNNRWPVLIHQGLNDSATELEARFLSHGWPAQWRGGVFDYHHYHSSAHEALGVFQGHARLMLGGPDGQSIDIEAGDVLVLPAGTGHCQLIASTDFQLVGAYPADQQDWDLCRPAHTDIQQARQRIAGLSCPALNPVHGNSMDQHWSARTSS